jgi:hypothetical protein
VYAATHPRVYEVTLKNSTHPPSQVDAKLGLVQDKITELTKQLESKIPRAPKKTDAKDN